MKKIVFIFLMFVSSFCSGQNRANVWMLGLQYTLVSPVYRPAFVYVDGAMDTLTMNPYPMDFFATCHSICDTAGELQFYTNGQWIANKNNDTLLGSKNFNPGFATDVYYQHGLGIPQGILILPKPDSHNIYCLFHESFEQWFLNPWDHYNPFHLSYSEIDMQRDSGKGEMILKNKIILNDTLIKGRLTACKHANGRDWWIISHEYNTNQYYKFLLTPDSLYGPYSQNIGQTIFYDVGSNSCFSSDGNWYATVSDHDGKFDIMRFDRCTGDFFDCISTQLPIDTDFAWLGLSFSANCRFLYVNNFSNLLQYDLLNSNILNSMNIVGVWDSNCNLGCSPFFLEQLAPDNKIYLNTWGATYNYHKIEFPDSIGLSCNFIQRAITFSNWNSVIPNFPNYDLGVLTGSECDTLNKPPETEFHFSLYPNPVSDQLNISFHVENESKLKVYDVLGREVMEFTLYTWFKSNAIDVSKLTSGLYLYEVSDRGKRLQAGKFIKIRASN